MSPIKGLTDRGAALPRIGILRKGGPKPEKSNRPGADLSYFRFVTEYPEIATTFEDAYGAQPKQINVFFLFDGVVDNFDAWQEEWAAGGLKHRCDGETCVLWLDTKTGKYRTDPKPCPGGCKAVGRLSVLVKELGHIATVTALTTSKNDIASLQESLEAAKWLHRDRAHPEGRLAGIPFVLCRREREISTPTEDKAKRARRKKSLLFIEPAHHYAVAALKAMDITPLLLPAGQTNGESEEEEEEFADAITGEIFPPSEDHGKPEPPKSAPRPAPTAAPSPVGWPDIPESFTSTGKLSEWIVKELKIAPADIWKEIAAATNSKWSKPTEVADRADLVVIATALRNALCEDPDRTASGMPEPPEEGEFEERE